MKQDFEWAQLTETTTNNVEEPTKFAYPPLPWIGARFKFEVREKDGSKVLTKTIDNTFFQRATVFMGDPNTENYTIEADVMSEGNRRKMSEVGNYLSALFDRAERQRTEAGDQFQPGAPARSRDGRTVEFQMVAQCLVSLESDAWTMRRTVPAWCAQKPGNAASLSRKNGRSKSRTKPSHQNGSPGLFGFSPQDMRVFIDNISVTPNRIILRIVSNKFMKKVSLVLAVLIAGSALGFAEDWPQWGRTRPIATCIRPRKVLPIAI